MKSNSKITIAICLLILVACCINATMASSENTEKAVVQEQSQKSTLRNHTVKEMKSKKVFKQNNTTDSGNNTQQLQDNEWPLCIPTIGHTCPP